MKNIVMKKLMKYSFLLKLATLSCVLFYLIPVYLLAVGPTIKKQKINNVFNYEHHTYEFDICSVSDELIDNHNCYILEVVLFARYFNPMLSTTKNTIVPDNYNYDKKKHKFIHVNSQANDTCSNMNIIDKYKIFIYNFPSDLDKKKIRVKGVDTNHWLPKSLEFDSFSNNDKLICIAYEDGADTEMWSKKTCFDKNGFAYFSSQHNIDCVDLISAFNKPPIFNKDEITQKIKKEKIKVGKEWKFRLPAKTFTDEECSTLNYTATNLPNWLMFYPTEKTFKGTPRIGDAKSYTITVKATDDANHTANGSFVITVEGKVNNSPVYVGNKITDQSVNEDEMWDWTFPADKFNDPDGDNLTYKAKVNDRPISPSPSSFWLNFDSSTQKFRGTPSNNHVGKHTIIVTATDGKAEASTSFVLTVKNVNDAPKQIKRIKDQSYDANQFFSFHIRDYFQDIDKGDALKYKATLIDGSELPLPKWLKFNETSGLFNGTIPKDHPQKTYTISVKANDRKQDSTGNKFFFVVNASPNINNTIKDEKENEYVKKKDLSEINIGKIPLFVFEQNKSKIYTIKKSTFSDNNNTFEYKLEPSQNINKDMSWLHIDDEHDHLKITGHPTSNHNGVYVANLVFIKPDAKAYSANIQIKVQRQAIKNNPPQKNNNLEDQTILINEKFQYPILKNTFTDDEPLTYEATLSNGEPLPNWLHFNKGQRLFHGTPTKIGTFTIKVTASNSSGDISGNFEIKVNPVQTDVPETSNPAYKLKVFAPIDQNKYTINPEIVTLILSKDEIEKRQIRCPMGSHTCSFSAPPDIKNYSCHIWNKSGDYIGVLSEKKSHLDEKETIVFVKKPTKCGYLNKRGHRSDKFEEHMKEIHTEVLKTNKQPNDNIGINITNFKKFYSVWTTLKEPFIQSQCGKFCNIIFLDDDNSYFQRFNNYWSFKTIDYSKGPLLIPIPITTKLNNIYEEKKLEPNKNSGDKFEFKKIIFKTPTANYFKEYENHPNFGMVQCNKQFKIPDGFAVRKTDIITSIDSKNKIVYSPVFCDRNKCKYYSPSSFQYTLYWQKDNTDSYRFISSLPSQNHIQRYKLLYSRTDIKENKVIQALYYTMRKNNIVNVCINQEYNKICFNDFLIHKINRNKKPDFTIDKLSFKYNANGNYIVLDKKHCLKKIDDNWNYITLPDLTIRDIIMFSFQKTVSPQEKTAKPCFWGKSITYYETPVYHSEEKHYLIKNSKAFSIGYKNFIQDQMQCHERDSFSKWIIVDEFENDENSFMTELFSQFRKKDLKKLIKQLPEQRNYRLDGIKANGITRIYTTEPDFAIRTTTDFVKSIHDIEPHRKAEQYLDWELHVFVPRKTSVDSFNISEMDLLKIKNKLKSLNVKRFCIWEFSYVKPKEETAYKKFINSLKHASFETRYKIVYDKKQFSEIKKVITRKST